MLKIHWFFVLCFSIFLPVFPGEMNEVIKCSICLGPLQAWPYTIDLCKYENTTHSFCTDCLNSSVNSTDNPSCPLCRKTITFGNQEKLTITKELQEKMEKNQSTVFNAAIQEALDTQEERLDKKTKTLSNKISQYHLENVQLQQYGLQTAYLSNLINNKNQEINLLRKKLDELDKNKLKTENATLKRQLLVLSEQLKNLEQKKYNLETNSSYNYNQTKIEELDSARFLWKTSFCILGLSTLTYNVLKYTGSDLCESFNISCLVSKLSPFSLFQFFKNILTVSSNQCINTFEYINANSRFALEKATSIFE